MIKLIDGDILESNEDFICHQVNCQGVMGAGIAKALSDKWPIVKERYLSFSSGARTKCLLGEIQAVPINDKQAVLNIFGQEFYGKRRDVIYTNYIALEHAFALIRFGQEYKNKSFAFPFMFGCGLANGNWTTVFGMMKRYLIDKNVTIYRLDN